MSSASDTSQGTRISDCSLQITGGALSAKVSAWWRDARGRATRISLSHGKNLQRTIWNALARLDRSSIEKWLGKHVLADVPLSMAIDRLITSSCRDYITALDPASLMDDVAPIRLVATKLPYPLNNLKGGTLGQFDHSEGGRTFVVQEVFPDKFFKSDDMTELIPGSVRVDLKQEGPALELTEARRLQLNKMLADAVQHKEESRLSNTSASELFKDLEPRIFTTTLTLKDLRLSSGRTCSHVLTCPHTSDHDMSQTRVLSRTLNWLGGLISSYSGDDRANAARRAFIESTAKPSLAEAEKLRRPAHIPHQCWSELIYKATKGVVTRAIAYFESQMTEGPATLDLSPGGYVVMRPYSRVEQDQSGRTSTHRVSVTSQFGPGDPATMHYMMDSKGIWVYDPDRHSSGSEQASASDNMEGAVDTETAEVDTLTDLFSVVVIGDSDDNMIWEAEAGG